MNEKEVHHIAKELGVEPNHVRLMEGRLAAQDDAFDGSAEDDEEAYSPSHYLHDPAQDPARIAELEDYSAAELKKLRSAFSELDERAREIVESRWLRDDKMTLHE